MDALLSAVGTAGEMTTNWDGRVFLKCIRNTCPYTETCGFLWGHQAFTFKEYYCYLCGSELIATSSGHEMHF